MNQPPVPPRPPVPRRKRPAPEAPPRRVQWVYVDPVPTPMLTAEEIAALDAADAAREQARLKRCVPRRPQHCKVGYSYYQHSDRPVPYIRLRGGWLTELGFVTGTQVRIEMLKDALVLTRLPPPPAPPPKRKRNKR